MTTVSVVMPVHNGGDELARAVDAVLRQDGPEFELIVVDDGSSDGAVARLPGDARLTVVRLDRNLGVSGARNAALRRARGEFVAFADADDIMLPGMLKTLLTTARTHGADIAVCGYYLDVRADMLAMRVGDPRLHDNEFLCIEGWNGATGRSGFPEMLERLLESDLFHPVYNKLYRRRLLDGLWFDENLFVCFEDERFNLEVFAKADRIAVTTGILYRTDFSRPGILSRRYDDNRYFNILKLWERYETLLQEFDGLRTAAHKQLLLHYIGLLADLGESAHLFDPAALFRLVEDIMETPVFRRAATALGAEAFFMDAAIHFAMESVLPALRRRSCPAFGAIGNALLNWTNLLHAVYSFNRKKGGYFSSIFDSSDRMSAKWRDLLPEF